MFKQVLPLTSIMFIRFFGMFIVMPILSIYALEMEGATELLVGLTFGAYSLAQMIFVVPFGKLSDKIGRKITIIIGLVIFAIGSLVAANSSDIYMLLLGRLLQGAGAISAVTSALISDIVKEEMRTKAMAIVGMGIGLSSILSMIVGPIIAAKYDLSMLFVMTFVFVIIELLILVVYVPNPPKVNYRFKNHSTLKDVFKNREVMTMAIINLYQKALITITFVITPVIFVNSFGWGKDELIWVYVPAFVLGFFAMGGGSVFAEKKGKYKQVLLISISLFALAYLFFTIEGGDTTAIIAVILFFIGFNMFEPIIQSLTTKYAKSYERGVALGLFSGFGFFGSTIGGVIGGVGIMEGYLDIIAIAVVLSSVLLFIMVVRMHNPKRLKNLYIDDTVADENRLDKLVADKKIIEWYVNENEKLAIIKYDEQIISEDELNRYNLK